MCGILLLAVAAPGAGAQIDLTSIIAEADRLYDLREDTENVRQSIRILEQGLADSPDAYPVLWRLARAYEWVGRYAVPADRVEIFTQATTYAGRAVDADPMGVDGRYWNALTTGRLGEARGILRSLAAASEMRTELETVLELAPEHAGAHFALGMLYHQLPGWPISFGNNNQALEYMSVAVALAPENTTYLLGLAELLLDMRRRGEAADYLEAVIEMPLTPTEPVESAEDKERARELLARLR